jgi:aspartate/methionine/tyrosine aminotransferase
MTNRRGPAAIVDVAAPAVSRRSAVEPFIAMDVMSAAARREAAGARVVHMEVGQPSAPAPSGVLAAARIALELGRIGYTEALGLPALRARIARHYRDRHGLDVPAERIVVTTGSSGAFNLLFLAAFDPGDRVAVPAPGYPAYRNVLAALSLEPVDIETTAASRWVLDPEHLGRAHDERPLKGVLVASPNNPTGTLMTPQALGAAVGAARERGLWFISDEIYHGLVYEGAEETALAFSDEAVVVNSFSKYYCMTGWRVGWMVVPERLVRPIERIAQSLYISVPELSQRAAIAAFDAADELETVKAGYRRNRDILLARLPGIGFDEILPADGAFYVYAGVRRFSNDSVAFARRMLEEAGVAATPGPDFDRARGGGYIRFSFAGAEAEMIEAMDRFAHWLR